MHHLLACVDFSQTNSAANILPNIHEHSFSLLYCRYSTFFKRLMPPSRQLKRISSLASYSKLPSCYNACNGKLLALAFLPQSMNQYYSHWKDIPIMLNIYDKYTLLAALQLAKFTDKLSLCGAKANEAKKIIYQKYGLAVIKQNDCLSIDAYDACLRHPQLQCGTDIGPAAILEAALSCILPCHNSLTYIDKIYALATSAGIKHVNKHQTKP